MFPFEGLMAEVLVTNRIEWCAVRWLLQKQGNLEDRCEHSEKRRHTEAVSYVYLGYLQFTRHLSACMYFPRNSLYITDIKTTLIYVILTYLCVYAETVDAIKLHLNNLIKSKRKTLQQIPPLRSLKC